MARCAFLLALLPSFTTTIAQVEADSVRVVTSTRPISRSELPTDAVYDNAILLSPAEFPGGESALQAHFTAASAKAINTVEISFVVETDGSVNEVQVMKNGDPAVQRSLLRTALAMPAWQPAVVQGQPVRARVVKTVTAPAAPKTVTE